MTLGEVGGPGYAVVPTLQPSNSAIADVGSSNLGSTFQGYSRADLLDYGMPNAPSSIRFVEEPDHSRLLVGGKNIYDIAYSTVIDRANRRIINEASARGDNLAPTIENAGRIGLLIGDGSTNRYFTAPENLSVFNSYMNTSVPSPFSITLESGAALSLAQQVAPSDQAAVIENAQRLQGINDYDRKVLSNNFRRGDEMAAAWDSDGPLSTRILKTWDALNYVRPDALEYRASLMRPSNIQAATLDNMLASPFSAIAAGISRELGGTDEDIYNSSQLGKALDGVVVARGSIHNPMTFTGAVGVARIEPVSVGVAAYSKLPSNANYGASIVTRDGGFSKNVSWFNEAAVLDNMASSNIGRQVLGAARENKFRLEFSRSFYQQGINGNIETGVKGFAFQTKAKIYLPAHRSNAEVASTSIHEGVHMLGVAGSRRAEALARLAEMQHQGKPINFSSMRQVLRDINSAEFSNGEKVYGNYRWQLGEQSQVFPGVRY